jgi:hypothetical protein
LRPSRLDRVRPRLDRANSAPRRARRGGRHAGPLPPVEDRSPPHAGACPPGGDGPRWKARACRRGRRSNQRPS